MAALKYKTLIKKKNSTKLHLIFTVLCLKKTLRIYPQQPSCGPLEAFERYLDFYNVSTCLHV